MITSSEYSSALAMQVKTVRCPLAWALAGTTLLLALPLAGHATPPGKSGSPAKGEFAFTGTEQCAYASAFGPPPVLEAKGPVTLLTSVLQGTLSLAADGTGRLTGRIASLQAVSDTGATPAMQSSLTCEVTHELAANGELRLERTCRGTRLRGTGSETAQTWSASAVQETGHFAMELTVLADTRLAVESLSVVGVNLVRVCHRTSWIVRKK